MDSVRPALRRVSRLTLLPGVLVVGAALVGTGCGTRATVEQRVDEDDGAVSQSTTFGRESELERADRLLGERDFPAAIEIYRRLYRSSPDQRVRASALLNWARAEGSLLNPDRDLDRAIARLELLLSEFESGPAHDEAVRQLEDMRGLRDEAEPR